MSVLFSLIRTFFRLSEDFFVFVFFARPVLLVYPSVLLSSATLFLERMCVFGEASYPRPDLGFISQLLLVQSRARSLLPCCCVMMQ